MATKRTTATATATATATPATPATATPKFRATDAEQFLTHAKKMDGIHVAKSAPRKFANFVNLTVNEIAELLAAAEIENVNTFINVAVNAKSPDGVRDAIAAGRIAELSVRKK